MPDPRKEVYGTIALFALLAVVGVILMAILDK